MRYLRLWYDLLRYTFQKRSISIWYKEDRVKLRATSTNVLWLRNAAHEEGEAKHTAAVESRFHCLCRPWHLSDESSHSEACYNHIPVPSDLHKWSITIEETPSSLVSRLLHLCDSFFAGLEAATVSGSCQWTTFSGSAQLKMQPTAPSDTNPADDNSMVESNSEHRGLSLAAMRTRDLRSEPLNDFSAMLIVVNLSRDRVELGRSYHLGRRTAVFWKSFMHVNET